MNKFYKIVLAIMGATDAVFRMFTPLAVALIIVGFFVLREWQQTALVLAAIIATLYRGLRLGWMNNGR